MQVWYRMTNNNLSTGSALKLKPGPDADTDTELTLRVSHKLPNLLTCNKLLVCRINRRNLNSMNVLMYLT